MPLPTTAPAAPPQNLQIRLVQSAREWEAVARLRYEVYVEEMGRHQDCADHLARTILEPIDARSLVVGAFEASGRALATVRLTPVSELDASAGDFYGWTGRDDVSSGGACLASKLMVAAERRRSLLGIEVMRAATVEFLRRGWRFIFLDANDHLVALYTRIGFVAKARREHPVYGSVTIMEWDLHDLEHARSVHSPMLAELAARQPYDLAA